jgi:hypothetical protein
MAMTIGELREACMEVPRIQQADLTKVNKCLGYFEGFADGTALFASSLPYCIPPVVTRGQVVAMYVRKTDADPSTWHLPARGPVVQMFMDSFPCKP